MQTKLPQHWILSSSVDAHSHQTSDDELQPEKILRNLQWTRVMRMEQINADEISVFNIDADVHGDKSIDQVRNNPSEIRSQLLFDPEEYKGRQDELTIALQTLTKEELV